MADNTNASGKNNKVNIDFHDMAYAQKHFNLQMQNAKDYNKFLKQLAKEKDIYQRQLDARRGKLDEAQQKKLKRDMLKAEKQAAAAAKALWENSYSEASKSGKAKMLRDKADIMEQEKANIQETLAFEIGKAGNNTKKIAAAKEKAAKAQQAIDKESAELRRQAARLEQQERLDGLNVYKDKLKSLKDKDNKNKLQTLQELSKVDVAEISKILDESVSAAEEEIADLDAQIEEKKKNGEDTSELEAEKLAKQRQKDQLAATATLVKAINSVQDQYEKTFKEVEGLLATYKGTIEARLQGSEKSYDDVMNKISTNLSMSPFVKTQDVINTMKAAVDEGIAYNVEQRSFLQSIKDKIANTFDAFDSNLTRLIRLQQADTTAARMGMEAALTKFLNNMFQDTSYLNGLSDSVAAAIIDANSQLDRNSSAEFEYIVQKWLGSLASVGASDSLINNIATGINYLATGDVTSLSSNTQLQTLLAMSASKAGLEYSDLLLNGMNASNTNMLLESMVSYLKDIAENSDSQVVRSAYGNIFNMSLSDMKAISNLSGGDIANIAGNSLSYGGMQSELNYQMSQLYKRTSMAEMLSNITNNAIYGVASDMVNNPATYAMTKMLDFMETNKIDIAIPFVNAMGFGLDLNTSVQDIMRLGVGMTQTMSLLGNILGSLGAGGGTNLDAWGATEYNKRGSGMTFSAGSMFGGTTGSTYVATASSDDMKNSSLNSATDDADETSKITNKNSTTEHTFDDFYKATIGEAADSYINVQDVLFTQVFNSDANYLGVRDTRLKFLPDGELQTADTVLYTWLHNLFGDTSLVGKDGAIRVKEIASPFVTNSENGSTALPVHIASVAEELKFKVDKVTLSEDTVVKINTEELSKAFKTAMGYDEKTKEVKTMNDLITAIDEGTLVFRIKNESGQRLQVDTEWLGNVGYASQINW